MEHPIDDPAVALLHDQAVACENSLNSIVDRVPECLPESSSFRGTTRHAWDEERTRFMLWRGDLTTVIADTYQQDPKQAHRIAESNISANLKYLASDLVEVLAVVSGSRPPLEEQESSRIWSADEGEAEPDLQELVERLDAVTSTIDGLFRMLKLQHSYASQKFWGGSEVWVDGTRALLDYRQTDETTWGMGASTAVPPLIGHHGPKASTQAEGSMPSIPSMPEYRDQDTAYEDKNSTSSLSTYEEPARVDKNSTSSLSAYEEPARGDKDLTSSLSAYGKPAHGDKTRTSPLAVNPDAMRGSNSYGSFRPRPQKFFKVGRVFVISWVEPASKPDVASKTDPLGFGETAYSKMRRFIIVKQDRGHVLAVPISSYTAKMAKDSRARNRNHAIAYMGPQEPQPLANEGKMLTPGIRIVADDPTERLHPSARIDFGKIYTIETDVKCRGIGIVHDSCLRLLSEHHHNAVLGRENSSQGLAIISEEDGSSVEKKSHTTSNTEPDTGNTGTEASINNQTIPLGRPAPALRSFDLRQHRGHGSDSGYGDSRAATEVRSVASSMIDPAERIGEDDDLGPGRILTYVDAQKLEVPVFDPENPSTEQLQALSDSSLQFLLDSLLAEQQRRIQARSTL